MASTPTPIESGVTWAGVGIRAGCTHGLGRRRNRQRVARSQIKNRFAEAVQLIHRSVRSKFIFVNQALLHRALEMYERRQDQSWGLVDCASFIVMADASSTDAFTSDRHFEQAGYRCLLPTS